MKCIKILHNTTALFLTLLLSAMLWGGCTGGCGGCTGTPGYTFPSNKVQNGIMKARLTKSGLDFIESHLKELIQSTLGSVPGFSVDPNGRIRFALPKGDNGGKVNCPAGVGGPETNYCLYDYPIGFNIPFIGRIDIANFVLEIRSAEVTIDFGSLDLELIPSNPPKVHFSIDDAKIGFEGDVYGGLRVHIPYIIDETWDVGCRLDNGLAQGAPDDHMFKADMAIDVTLEVDQNGNFQSAMDVPLLDIEGLDVVIRAPKAGDPQASIDTCIDSDGQIMWFPHNIGNNECTFVCPIPNTIVNVLEGVRNFLDSILDWILRMTIPRVVQLLILDQLNGQPLKLEGQLKLSDLLEGIMEIPFLARTNPIGFMVGPGPLGFQVNGAGPAMGLDITMNGGTEATPTNCAPILNPEPVYTPGPAPVFTGIDSQGQVYHFAATLSKAFLNQAMTTIYNSGLMCATISTEDILSLTGGEFAITTGMLGFMVPGLWEVAGRDAPIMIQLNPTRPPSLELGTGEDQGDTHDSLLKLHIDTIGLSFYALIDDHFARLFQATCNIDLWISVIPQPDNSIVLTIDKIKIGKLTEAYNEIFTNANLQEILDLLIRLVTDMLLGNQLSFQINPSDILTSVLGANIGMKIHEIVRDGSENDYLTLLVSLTEQAQSPFSFSAETSAKLAREYPPVARDTSGRRIATGFIGLDVGGIGRQGGSGDLEYQARVDRGAWGPFSRGPRIFIENSRLKLVGRHHVEVRARSLSDYRSLDPTPAKLSFVVDPVPPALTLVPIQGGYIFEALDDFSPKEALRYSIRVDRGLWGPYGKENVFHFAGIAAGWHRLEVKVMDESGNETIRNAAFIAEGSGPETPRSPGCGVAGSSTSGPLLGGLLLLLGLALGAGMKGRRRLLPVLMAGLLFGGMMLSGCGKDPSALTCNANKPCPTGYQCKNGICVKRERCSDENRCCPGQICVVGLCINEIDECFSDQPCPKQGQVCQWNLDGGMTDGGVPSSGVCHFPTCTQDSDCSGGASCFNGYCRFPGVCGGGCQAGQVCVTPTDQCYPAPKQCESMTCNPGEMLVFDDPASLLGENCYLDGATCKCEAIPNIPMGDFGRDSALAVAGQSPVTSCYDKTYGDLVVVWYDSNGARTKVTYVDGIPSSGVPTGRPSGPRNGLSSPGPDVGRHTAITVNGNNEPLVAYYDIDNGDLKLAQYSSGGQTWSVHTVDGTDADLGLYTAITVDSSGKPIISYFQRAGGLDGGMTALKLARAKNAVPSGSGDWDLFVVDNKPKPIRPNPCNGACTGAEKCIELANPDGGMAETCVSPQTPPDGGSCNNNQIYYNNGCHQVLTAPPDEIEDLPKGVGLFSSVAVHPISGEVYISYYDSILGNLKASRSQAGGGFEKFTLDGEETIDGGVVDTGDVGRFSSIGFVPAPAAPHVGIAYYDVSKQDLVYYTGQDLIGGTREVVDTGLIPGGGELFVGADASLDFDSQGTPFIAYQDATFNDMMFAKRLGAGSWEVRCAIGSVGRNCVVDEAGGWGFFADMAFAGGKFYLSSFKFGFDNDGNPDNLLKIVVHTP